MWDSEDFKNYAKSAFYGVLFLSILVFTISYAFVDWEQVSEDSIETVKEIGNMLDCTIEYEQFRYEGICSDISEVTDLVRDLYMVNGTSAYE